MCCHPSLTCAEVIKEAHPPLFKLSKFYRMYDDDMRNLQANEDLGLLQDDPYCPTRRIQMLDFRWKILYALRGEYNAEFPREDPLCHTRQIHMLDFHWKILSALRGEYRCWTSTGRSLSSHDANTNVGLPQEGPCCPTRRIQMMDFHVKILITLRDEYKCWNSTRRSLPPLKIIQICWTFTRI